MSRGVARRARSRRLEPRPPVSPARRRRLLAGTAPVARIPEAYTAPTITPMPRSTHSGNSRSSTSWSSSVYGSATRKKSSSKRSSRRDIIGARLIPAPIARMTPSALSSTSACQPPSLSSSRRAVTPRVVTVVEKIEVVDQEQIYTLEPEPLQAVLERAPHAGISVVEIVLERETPAPRIAHRIPGIARRPQEAPDLRRHHELVAWQPAQEVAHTVLRKSVSVVRSRVEVAHARIPRRLERRLSLAVGNPHE